MAAICFLGTNLTTTLNITQQKYISFLLFFQAYRKSAQYLTKLVQHVNISFYFIWG
jgi:hypothetical protein